MLNLRHHSLNIAESSLAEVACCVHVASRLGYIDEKLRAELERDLNRVGAPLTGLIRSIRLEKTVNPPTAILIALLVGYCLS